MPESLYSTLGVDETVDEAGLKKAYRARSRATHPDKGGSEEDFTAVATAYAVLADPDARAHYDRTGETPQPRGAADPGEVRFLEILAKHIKRLSAGRSLIQQVRDEISNEIASLRDSVRNLTAARDKVKGQLGRYIVRINPQNLEPCEGENLIESTLKQTLQELEAALAGTEREIVALKSAQDHCLRYEDTRPPEVSASPPNSIFDYIDKVPRRATWNAYPDIP